MKKNSKPLCFLGQRATGWLWLEGYTGTNAIPVAAEFTGNRNENEWNAELS